VKNPLQEKGGNMHTPFIHREMVRLGNIDILLRDTRTNGQAILCLHGRWGRGETWVDFMQHYSQNYRVLAPDQRGHGLSSKPSGRYTAEEMASDMVQLLDYLDLNRSSWWGIPWAGTLAVTWQRPIPNT
jgi:2-succinyl-6-hydroxy-2,4-cyclohexadiene-1-carboxylate synthase